MLKCFFAFMLVINCSALFAQTGYEKDFELNFLWQVKQVNEFVERFNNNDSTLLKQYYLKQHFTGAITRARLIKSLFNAEKKNWNTADVQNFIKTIDNKRNPQMLNLYGDKWNAIVNCTVTWNRKPQNVVLTLKLMKLTNEAYKWIVVNADAKFLKTIVYNTLFRIPKPADSTTSLNPVSHTTEFMNIDKICEDKKNISNYFIKTDNYTGDTLPFIRECLNGHLLINQANAVSYSFAQVSGWTFEVRQYNRQSKNSGWLISKLTKTSSN